MPRLQMPNTASAYVATVQTLNTKMSHSLGRRAYWDAQIAARKWQMYVRPKL